MRIYVILFIALLTSCHDKNTLNQNYSKELAVDDEMEIEPPRSAEPSPLPPSVGDIESFSIQVESDQGNPRQQPTNQPIKVSSMIIKEGRMSIDVEDLSLSKDIVDALLQRHHGYYQNEEYYDQTYAQWFQLTLRIPNASFDRVVEELSKGRGKVTEKNIDVRDITEEYVDLELRLANNERYVERYLKLLGRADSIKDMLVIQEKIRNIEEEIEAKKGRINYLTSRVKYSTLRLNLKHHEPVLATTGDDHFGTKLASSFIVGYNSLLSFVLSVLTLWPFLLIVPIVLFFGRKWKRLERRNVLPMKD